MRVGPLTLMGGRVRSRGGRGGQRGGMRGRGDLGGKGAQAERRENNIGAEAGRRTRVVRLKPRRDGGRKGRCWLRRRTRSEAGRGEDLACRMEEMQHRDWSFGVELRQLGQGRPQYHSRLCWGHYVRVAEQMWA